MSREGDLMYQILPAVKMRRATLESGANNNIILTLDYYIDDHLTSEGAGFIMSLPNSFDADAGMPKEEEFMKALKIGIIISHHGRDTWINRQFNKLAKYRVAIDEGASERDVSRHLPAGMRGRAASMGAFLDKLKTTTKKGSAHDNSPTGENVRFHPFLIKTEPARQALPNQYFDDFSEHFRVTNVGTQPAFYRIPYTITIGNDPEIPNELISGDTTELSVHAFTYLDFSLLGLDLDHSDIKYLNLLHGRKSKDTILRRGRVDSYTMVLRDSKGVPYGGPYHMMPPEDDRTTVFMKGLRHSDASGPDDYLTAINVPNTKIQDFRKMQRTNDLYTPLMLPSIMQQGQVRKFLKSKREKNFNAQLFVHQNPDSGVVDYKFIIDQKQILEKESSLGHLFKYLPNLTKYEILRPKVNFKLLNTRVLRRRVTDRSIGIDSLGFPAKDLFDKNTPDFVVAEASQEWFLNRNERSMKRAGLPSDLYEHEDNLVDAILPAAFAAPRFLLGANDNSRETGTMSDLLVRDLMTQLRANFDNLSSWLTGNPEDPMPIDNSSESRLAGTPLFPFYRIFHGRDYSLMKTVDGTYQYGIELEYEDSIYEYFEHALNRLKEQILQLEEYYNLANIPVITGKSFRETRGNGPSRDEILNVDRVRFTPVGNYNTATKKFSPSFVSEAMERFDFEAMQAVFFELLGLVYANKKFIISASKFAEHLTAQGEGDFVEAAVSEGLFTVDSAISLRDDAMVGLVATLLNPNNSRPEQILQILKSFKDLSAEVDKLLGGGSSADQSSLSSEIGGRRNLTAGKNRTLRVKRWFTGHRDSEPSSYYVDCSKRKLDSVSFVEQENRWLAENQRQADRRAAGARLRSMATMPTIQDSPDNPQRTETLQDFATPGFELSEDTFLDRPPTTDPVPRPPLLPLPSPVTTARSVASTFPVITAANLAGRMNTETTRWGSSMRSYLGNSAVLTFSSYRGNATQTNSHFTWGDNMTTPGSFVINWQAGAAEVNRAMDVINMSRQATQDPAIQSFDWGDVNEAASPNDGQAGTANPFDQPSTALNTITARMAAQLSSVTNFSVTVPSEILLSDDTQAIPNEGELCGVGNEPDEPEGFPFDWDEHWRSLAGANTGFLDLSRVLVSDMGNVINPDVLTSNLVQGTSDGLQGLGPGIGGLAGPRGESRPDPVPYPAVSRAVTDAAVVVERMDGFARDADGNINLGRPIFSTLNQDMVAAGRVLSGQYRLRYAQDSSTEAGNQTAANWRPYTGEADGGNTSATRPAQGQSYFEVPASPPSRRTKRTRRRNRRRTQASRQAAPQEVCGCGPYYLFGTSDSGDTSGVTGYFYPLYLTSVCEPIEGLETHAHTFLEYPGIVFYMPNESQYHGEESPPPEDMATLYDECFPGPGGGGTPPSPGGGGAPTGGTTTSGPGGYGGF